VNSKQVVAAVSAVVLIVILVYPALATATVSVLLQSPKISKADHVYATVGNVWVHTTGASSGDGWQLVSNQSQPIDLVLLQNASLHIAKGQVPLAGYDSIRMEISNVTWVFNGTTTKLALQNSQLQANLSFNVQAGREFTITLALGGTLQSVSGVKFFIPSMNATLTQAMGK
jgi:hypothetical protein